MGMHIRKGGKFMKLKKKSGLMGAVIALSAASLISVGFASWVISQGDTQSVNGQIIVDTVDNQSRLIRNATGGKTFEVAYGTNKANQAASGICYGWDSTGVTATGEFLWLTNTDQSKAENLTASVDFYVSNLAEGQEAKLSGSVALDSEAVTAAKFNAAVSAGYIASLEDVDIAFVIDDDTTVVLNELTFTKVTANLTFAWGSHFNLGTESAPNIVNPYKFYNDGVKKASTVIEGTTTWADDAYASLHAIEEIQTIGFVLTLSVVGN